LCWRGPESGVCRHNTNPTETIVTRLSKDASRTQWFTHCVSTPSRESVNCTTTKSCMYGTFLEKKNIRTTMREGRRVSEMNRNECTRHTDGEMGDTEEKRIRCWSALIQIATETLQRVEERPHQTQRTAISTGKTPHDYVLTPHSLFRNQTHTSITKR
jgi:hypothetical protein